MKPDRALRQAVTDELMLQLARLLPEKYRGVYDLPAVEPRYLRFIKRKTAGNGE